MGWYEKDRVYDFYGVDSNFFKLDDAIYEVVADPSDGYRSFMKTVRVTSNISDLIFHHNVLDKVKVRHLDYKDVRKYRPGTSQEKRWSKGFKLVGTDSHVWLIFGTDFYNDWYPVFIFNYNPKLP